MKNILSIQIVLRIPEAGWQVAVLLSLPQLAPAPPPHKHITLLLSRKERGGWVSTESAQAAILVSISH